MADLSISTFDILLESLSTFSGSEFFKLSKPSLTFLTRERSRSFLLLMYCCKLIPRFKASLGEIVELEHELADEEVVEVVGEE